MAVFRVDKNRNYTVMSNYHLRDTNMSLKAIGLLSKMLSLTDEWDYTTRGLAAICKEGVDAIGAALKELEKCGYLVRRQLRDSRGRITDTEYTIYEYPHTPSPDTTSSDTSQPDTENPDMEEPDTAEPYPIKTAQLNTDKPIPEKRNTDSVSTDPSNPDPSSTGGRPALMSTPVPVFGYDGMGYEETRELVMENLDYDIMAERYERSRMDEIVELVTETLCSGRPTIVVSGEEYPAQLVKDRLMKLTSSHIEYAFDCIDKNTTYVRNIKKYLLEKLKKALRINAFENVIQRNEDVISCIVACAYSYSNGVDIPRELVRNFLDWFANSTTASQDLILANLAAKLSIIEYRAPEPELPF